MNFHCLYHQGFVRLAAATMDCTLADPAANADAVLRIAGQAHARRVALVVLPELCLSGYSIDDLRQQDTLLNAVEQAIERLVEASTELLPMLLVGAPLQHRGRLYNCAVCIHRGRLLGVVPKMHLPNYREFYELRHFAPGDDVQDEEIRVGRLTAPFGRDLLFQCDDIRDFCVHVEICEDLWVPVPPSAAGALSGATVLANLSASNITIGKADIRRLLCQSQSARCLAAYLYAAAGTGESTTDLAWDGQASIFENGQILAETDRFPSGERIAIADIDLDALRQERMRMGSFEHNRRVHAASTEYFRRIAFRLDAPAEDLGLLRSLERFPFVPADENKLAQDCYEAYNIQVSGLVQRLRATHIDKLVIGVSGGLDSTHALLVCAQAMDLLQLPRSNILAFTLPGFATSDETKANAIALMTSLRVTQAEIDIRPMARKMLADMDHPFARGEEVYDLTFENVQAGLRTDYLFRLAGQRGGLVVGTGDLSELALGWCTYGVGDQMSHYNVNAGVPKTLIQHLIRWVIGSRQFDEQVLETLQRVINTEISPELVPALKGERPQSTQAKIGPYELQDFNLFYTLRFGYRPSKIAFLALQAWGDAQRGDWPPGFPADARHAYTLGDIRHWLRVFVHRYFGFTQYKRSAMPNGPKVSGGGSLSPRGDWRAPSDGNARIWEEELERNVPAS